MRRPPAVRRLNDVGSRGNASSHGCVSQRGQRLRRVQRFFGRRRCPSDGGAEESREKAEQKEKKAAKKQKEEEKQNKAAAKKAAMAKAQEDKAAEKSRKRSRDEAKKVEQKIDAALPKIQSELAQPGTLLVPELVMSNARLAASFLEDQLKKAKLVQDGHVDQGLIDMKTLKKRSRQRSLRPYSSRT